MTVGNHLLGIDNMSQISEARLWKSLDGIGDRLSSIESQLSEIVRLEERVNNQESALNRQGHRLDDHDTRLRESELWQANYGDRSSVERLVTNIQDEVRDLKKKLSDIEKSSNVNKGQKDISKEILKWTAGILAALLVYKITRG